MRTKILLITILLLASFLRFFALDKFPPALFGDEVDVGYQSYSLLKTGRDYKGNLLPVYMDSLAEQRAPLLMYATAPFIKIFGVNEVGVRIPSAFFGVFTILFLFLIVKELLASETMALLAAFLLTISPWHLGYSRAAYEVSLLLFLILAGTYFFLRALRGKTAYLYVSILFFCPAFYTYNTANVFVPFWVISLLFAFREKVIKRWLKSSFQTGSFIILGLLLVSPVTSKFLRGSAATRFNLISIFSDPRMMETIIFKRSQAIFGSLAERIFYNRPVFWVKAFISNYLEALSPKFLFINGDPNPRQTIPGFGLLFLSFLPPLLVGIYQSIKNKKLEHRLLLGWLLIAPLASCFTMGGNTHATRLILMLPPLVILTSLGVMTLFKTKPGKLATLFLTAILIFEFSFYCREVTYHYPREQYLQWHYGYKEAIRLYQQNQDHCQTLYLNNAHSPFLIRYLFWTETDPRWFQKNFTLDQEDQVVDDVFLSFQLGNSYFGRIISPDKFEGMKKMLTRENSCYIAFQEDDIPGDWDFEKSPNTDFNVLGTVRDPFEKPLMYLLTLKN